MTEPEYVFVKGKGWVLHMPNRLKTRLGGFLLLEHRLPNTGECFLRLSKVYDQYYLDRNLAPNWEIIKDGFSGCDIHDFDTCKSVNFDTTRYVYVVISKL